MMTRARALYSAWKRRKVAQDVKAYRFLAATPGDATVGITLPANALIGVSSDTATNQGDIVVSFSADQITIPGGPAGKVFELIYGERGELVKVVSSTGNATLHVLDQWHRPTAIATTGG